MGKELAFVLINPYTIRKSRTGGVIARYLNRTQLDLVGARMFGPSKELAESYAELVRGADRGKSETCDLISDYILKSYSPDPETGKVHRVMLLVFEGENAVEKVWQVTGSATLRWGSGETVRDTYGDYVVDADSGVQYFEPAVLVAPSKRRAAATLSLWAKHSPQDGGVIDAAMDVSEGEEVEKTLVLIKPDSFREKRSRAGGIIDVLSTSGLRIIGIRKFRMTVANAEDFYGPVRDSLSDKFKGIGCDRAKGALSREFGFDVSEDVVEDLCAKLGPAFAESQFEQIVEYMTGYKPSDCNEKEKKVLGAEDCLALVYDGVGAVDIIRKILGATDPSKASPGSIRREFGSTIMVNAAHASDSRESAERELAIVDIAQDSVKPLIDRYYGNLVSKLASLKGNLPRAGFELMRRLRGKSAGKGDDCGN